MLSEAWDVRPGSGWRYQRSTESDVWDCGGGGATVTAAGAARRGRSSVAGRITARIQLLHVAVTAAVRRRRTATYQHQHPL